MLFLFSTYFHVHIYTDIVILCIIVGFNFSFFEIALVLEMVRGTKSLSVCLIYNTWGMLIYFLIFCYKSELMCKIFFVLFYNAGKQLGKFLHVGIVVSLSTLEIQKI